MNLPNPSCRTVACPSAEPLESRIAPAGVQALSLGHIDGTNGFVWQEGVYTSISAAGDVNGDGLDDIVIGNQNFSRTPPTSTASIVFGKREPVSAFNPSLETVSIVPAPSIDEYIGTISGVGDLNGDGFADVAAGAVRDNSPINDNARVYVVFGDRTMPSEVVVSSLDGDNGFRLTAAADANWVQLSAAGDVNGDGFDDLLVGFAYASLGYHLRAYVIFGKGDGFPPEIEIASLDSQDGVALESSTVSISAIRGAGDVNGDGFDDIIIGAPRRGSDPAAEVAYVVFGRAGAFPTDFATVSGTDGFRIRGDATTPDDLAGAAVTGAGDLNGDGFDDLLIGAPDSPGGYGGNRGAAYIVYGRAGGRPSGIDLGNSEHTARILGEHFFLSFGASVAAAGDVNGDGFDDALIGEPGYAGFVHVVLGRAEKLPAEIDAPELDSSFGFRINPAPDRIHSYSYYGGHYTEHQQSTGRQLSSAGDFNGDGFDDIIIGSLSRFPSRQGSSYLGTHYVVFGASFPPPLDLVNSKTVRFTDVDGDLVTVKVSQGSLALENFKISRAGVGLQLQQLDLGSEFAGANVKISARPTALGGDGQVNVGFLNAIGVDLGRVSIDGDLGKLQAGSPDAVPGILSLTAGSIGKLGLSTQGGSDARLEVNVRGALERLVVHRGVFGSSIEAADPSPNSTEGSPASLGRVLIRGPVSDSSISARNSIESLVIRGDVTDSMFRAGQTIARLGITKSVADLEVESFAIGSIRIGDDASDLEIDSWNLDSLRIDGSLRGESHVSVNGQLGSLFVRGNIVGPSPTTPIWIAATGNFAPTTEAEAMAIGSVKVRGHVENMWIVGGGALFTPVRPDAQIGLVRVGGDWIASSLSAGVDSGSDRLYGNGNDLQFADTNPIVARIASVMIRGEIRGTPAGGDHFGFAAEEFGFFKVGGRQFALAPGAGNDGPLPLGLSGDVTLREFA